MNGCKRMNELAKMNDEIATCQEITIEGML
jgi:hypothetical protein